MKKSIVYFLAGSALLGGCTVYNLANTPSSYQPGLYSATTGQRLVGDSLPIVYAGWADYRVIHFEYKACRDTFSLPVVHGPAAEMKRPYPAGTVWIANATIWIDEAEISNQEWRQYEWHQLKNGVSAITLTPTTTAQPVADYYTSGFYNYYPVVGISYEQAQAFCKWRSQVVTALLNQKQHIAPSDTLNPAYVRCRYRLPTESEWETAAAVQSNLPFGTTCAVLPVQVVPEAATYLQQRSGSTKSEAEIRADIIAYNKTNPTLNIINYAQKAPYFIRTPTPGYVYQRPVNYYGLYQMLGNAAELVQEKGLTKGGSYLDTLADCRIKARGTYTKPAHYIGFRAAAVVSRPNQQPVP
ncbi:MAG: formylglycine-generating enzyme family protein [Janthinobacterium lividum]